MLVFSVWAFLEHFGRWVHKLFLFWAWVCTGMDRISFICASIVLKSGLLAIRTATLVWAQIHLHTLRSFLRCRNLSARIKDERATLLPRLGQSVSIRLGSGRTHIHHVVDTHFLELRGDISVISVNVHELSFIIKCFVEVTGPWFISLCLLLSHFFFLFKRGFSTFACLSAADLLWVHSIISPHYFDRHNIMFLFLPSRMISNRPFGIICLIHFYCSHRKNFKNFIVVIKF